MKTVEIIVWSDNSELEQVANIIHDNGYHTTEIRKEELGAYENKCNWSFCKAGMDDSICVDLFHALGQIVPTEQVAEMPLFRYVAVFIVDDDDTSEQVVMGMEDTAQEEEESKEDTVMEDKKTNVVMNIGMTTKDGVHLEIESAMDAIGNETDCTITKCIGFYKGRKEASLKVEIYGIAVDRAVSMASYFSHIFRQECVAVSVGSATVFVNDDYTEEEFIAWCEELDR